MALGNWRLVRCTGLERSLLIGASIATAAYAVLLVLGVGHSPDALWLYALPLGALVACSVAVWRRWMQMATDRLTLGLLAAAMSTYVIANLMYSVSWWGGESTDPGLSDVFFLGFYLLLVAAMSSNAAGLARSERLTFALGATATAFAAASAAAWLFGAALGQMATAPEHGVLSVAVTIAYPVFDMLVVALVFGTLALPRGLDSLRWSVIAAGLVVIALADASYSARLLAETYVSGTPFDALWGIGFVLVTWGVWLRPHSRNVDQLIPKWAAALPFGNIGLALFVLLSTPAPSDSHASRWFATIAIVLPAILGSATFFEYGRLLRMETLAMTDALTGIRNRRYAFDILTTMLSMRPRNVQYAILVIDLDDLKMINDQLGHAAGDATLRLVANAAGSVTRPSDLCARIGGDEFLLALTMVDVSESRVRAAAMETMERLRDRLRDETIGGRTVEFSVGLAVCPGDGESLDQLVQQADDAMYQDKRTRRANRS